VTTSLCNLRDVGGLPLVGGGVVRDGVLYRGDAPMAGDEDPGLQPWPPGLGDRSAVTRRAGDPGHLPVLAPSVPVLEVSLLAAANPTAWADDDRPYGLDVLEDSAMHEIEDALRIAERSGDDIALSSARMTLGLALVHRPTNPERDRGQKFLAEACDWISRWRYLLCELQVVKVYLARERARCGDRDQAIPLMHAAVDELFRDRQSLWSVPATGVLVETLLDRGTESDVAQAEATIERLAAVPADEGLAVRDIWLLRLRALLARAHGDDARYREYRDRYRDMAKTLGFEGHMEWAEALT
jgi:hypothetical protein